MSIDEQILKLHDGVVGVIRVAISRLYRLPVEELRVEYARLNFIQGGQEMNDVTYRRAMAVLEELRKAINEAANTVEAAKIKDKKAA